MSENYLMGLALVFIALAGWRDSASAVWFGLFMFTHAIFLGHLVDSDMMTYMATGGIFSTVAAAGCYGLRTSVNDVIALRMTAISAACLLTNIVSIIVWSAWGPMGGFIYVFSAILLASIAVIIKGDASGFGKNTGSRLGGILRANTDKHSDFLVELDIRETRE